MIFQMANTTSRGQQRDKPFRDALRMEIADAGEDRRSLRAVARALLDKAAEGDVQAIKEVGDRLDGKVPQGIIGGDEDDPAIQTVTKIELVGVRAADQNT